VFISNTSQKDNRIDFHFSSLADFITAISKL
jgi:hypothetical protein